MPPARAVGPDGASDMSDWLSTADSAGRHGRRLDCLHRVDDGTQELGDARSPTRHDVVVELDHTAVLDGGDVIPTIARGHRGCRLTTTLDIGEEDQVRIRRDDELVVQLRIAV